MTQWDFLVIPAILANPINIYIIIRNQRNDKITTIIKNKPTKDKGPKYILCVCVCVVFYEWFQTNNY